MWPLMKDAVTVEDRKILCDFINGGNRLTYGTETTAFEKAWSNWLGVKYSVFVTSGSTANFLLLASLKEKYKWPDGSRILVPACTWATNVFPVTQNGLQPVFCDIDPKTFSFDLTKKYEDITAVFITHLLGIVAPLGEIRESYPDAFMIEDVCESHGATFDDGSKVGSASDGSTFSFYYGHHMTTIEGGMVSTNDEDLYEIMRMKRSHGLSREIESPERRKELERKHKDVDNRFLFMTEGFNFRGNDLFAVLGQSQLKRLDENIEIRRRNYFKFLELIERRSDILLPLWKCQGNSSFCLPFILKDSNMCEKLKKYLEDNGIETRPVVGGNLLRQPAFSKYGEYGHYPNADKVHTNGFYIGNSQAVTEADMEELKKLIDLFV